MLKHGWAYVDPVDRVHYIATSTRGYIHRGKHVSVVTFSKGSVYRNYKLCVSSAELSIDRLLNHSKAVQFGLHIIKGIRFHYREMPLYSLCDLIYIYKEDKALFGALTGLPVSRCTKFRCGHNSCIVEDVARMNYFYPCISSAIQFAESVCSRYRFKITPDNVCVADRCIYDWGDFDPGRCDEADALAPFYYFIETNFTLLGFHTLIMDIPNSIAQKVTGSRWSFEQYVGFFKFHLRTGLPLDYFTRSPCDIPNHYGVARHYLMIKESVRFYVSYTYDRYLSTYKLFIDEIMPGFGHQEFKIPLFDDHGNDILSRYAQVISYGYIKKLLMEHGSSFANALYHLGEHETIHSDCERCKLFVELIKEDNEYNNLMTVGHYDNLPKKDGKRLSANEYYLESGFVRILESEDWEAEDGSAYRFKLYTNNFSGCSGLTDSSSPALPFVLSGSMVSGNQEDLKSDLDFYNLGDPVNFSLSEWIICIKTQFYLFTRKPFNSTTLPADAIKTGKPSKSGGAIIGSVANAGSVRNVLADGSGGSYPKALEAYMSMFDNSMYFSISVVHAKIAIQPANKPLRSIISGDVLRTDAMRCVSQYFHKRLASVEHIFIGKKTDIQAWTSMLRVINFQGATHQGSFDHSKFDRKVETAFQLGAGFLLAGLQDGEDALQRRHNLIFSTMLSFVNNLLLYNGSVCFKRDGVSSGNPITAYANTIAAQFNLLLAYLRAVIVKQHEQHTNDYRTSYQMDCAKLLFENQNLSEYQSVSAVFSKFAMGGLSDDVVAAVDSTICDIDSIAVGFADFGYNMSKNEKYYVNLIDEPITELMSRWPEFHPELRDDIGPLLMPVPAVERFICSLVCIEKHTSLTPDVICARLLSIILDGFFLLYSSRPLVICGVAFPTRQFVLKAIDLVNEYRSQCIETTIMSPGYRAYIEDFPYANHIMTLLEKSEYTVDDFSRLQFPQQGAPVSLPMSAIVSSFEVAVEAINLIKIPKGSVILIPCSVKSGHGLEYDAKSLIRSRASKRGQPVYGNYADRILVLLPYKINNLPSTTTRYADSMHDRQLFIAQCLSNFSHAYKAIKPKSLYVPYYKRDLQLTTTLFTTCRGLSDDVHLFTDVRHKPTTVKLYGADDLELSESIPEARFLYECFYCEVSNAAVYQCLECRDKGILVYFCDNKKHWFIHQFCGHKSWSSCVSGESRAIRCIKCFKAIALDEGRFRGQKSCTDCATDHPDYSATVGSYDIGAHECLLKFSHAKVVKILTTSARVKTYLHYISRPSVSEPVRVLHTIEDSGFVYFKADGLPYQRNANYSVTNKSRDVFKIGLEYFNSVLYFKTSHPIKEGDLISVIPNNTMFELVDNINYSSQTISAIKGGVSSFGFLNVPTSLHSLYPSLTGLFDSLRTNNITCLQGIAGAGKSTLITAIINACFGNIQPIVVACQSHDAVDLLGNRFVELEKRHKGSIVRVVPKDPSAVHTQLPIFERPGPLLYFTTLNSCGRLRGISAKLLIIDEASQMHDTAYVSAVAAIHPFRCLLCGDPQQIPTVLPDIDYRPCDANVYTRICQTNVHKLTTTWRFGPTLASLMSTFYGFSITSAKAEDTTVETLCYLHNASLEDDNLRVIYEFVKSLTIIHPSYSIMLVAPYNVYVSAYDSILRDFNVHCCTVYQSQGAEADIVIYLPVIREHGENRLNVKHIHIVACSRARCKLFILTNSTMFGEFTRLDRMPLYVGIEGSPALEAHGFSDVVGFEEHSGGMRYVSPLDADLEPITSSWFLGPVVHIEDLSESSTEALEAVYILPMPTTSALYMDYYPIEAELPRHPRQNAVYFDVEAVGVRTINHRNKHGELKTTMAFCELAARVGVAELSRTFNPGVWCDGLGYSPKVDPKAIVRNHRMFGDRAAASRLFNRVSKASYDYRGVLKDFLRFVVKHVNGQPVFYVKSYKLDMAALGPILSPASSDKCRSCRKFAYYADAHHNVYCANCISDPCYLCNIKFVDIDNFYPQFSLEKLHSEYCSLSHGNAHDARTDVLMTECLVVRLHRDLDYSVGRYGYNIHCDDRFGRIMRSIKCLFETKNPDEALGTYIGGGDVIGPVNNIDLKYNLCYYKHLDNCDCSAHIFLDCYVSSVFDNKDKYVVRASLDVRPSWHKDMYETTKSRSIYLDYFYKKYPCEIKFPTTCSGGSNSASYNFIALPCNADLYCDKHFSNFNTLATILIDAAKLGLILGVNLEISYVRSGPEIYRLDSADGEPSCADYPPTHLMGYTAQRTHNSTVNKAITIVDILKEHKLQLGRVLNLGASSGFGTSPMGQYFALQPGAIQVIDIDPRYCGAGNRRRRVIVGTALEALKIRGEFNTIVSDIYGTDPGCPELSEVVECILRKLKVGGCAFIKVTLTSISAVLQVVAPHFRVVDIHKAINPSGGVTSELWFAMIDYSDTRFVSRPDLLKLYYGNLVYLNKEPHKHRMLRHIVS